SYRWSPCRATFPPELRLPQPRTLGPGQLRRASWRRNSSRTSWPFGLDFRDLIDLDQHHRQLVLERVLHRLVVAFRVFSGAMLEAQVAQIVVNRVTPLHELIELGAVRSEVRGVRLNEKNEE